MDTILVLMVGCEQWNVDRQWKACVNYQCYTCVIPDRASFCSPNGARASVSQTQQTSSNRDLFHCA